MLERIGWGLFVIQEEVSACFVATMRSECNVLALSSESSDVMRQAVNQKYSRKLGCRCALNRTTESGARIGNV